MSMSEVITKQGDGIFGVMAVAKHAVQNRDDNLSRHDTSACMPLTNQCRMASAFDWLAAASLYVNNSVQLLCNAHIV